VTRNASSLIAFHVDESYAPGNPLALIASHVDSLCLKVKPISKSEKAGFERLAIAPYAGGGPDKVFDGSYSTWWDRDLGLAGRVLVQGKEGGVESRLVSLNRPVARIPSLAVHFGAPALGPFNYETNFVPIIGLAPESESSTESAKAQTSTYGPLSDRHSQNLLKALSHELGVSRSRIVDFSLELFDFQPGQLLGLSKEFISAPRLDDKLCSFSALWALINASSSSLHEEKEKKR